MGHHFSFRLERRLLAFLILTGFYFFILASEWDKGIAFDETAHAAGGYAAWKFNDFRIDSPNGILPNRLAAIPLLSAADRFPPLSSEEWLYGDEWKLGDEIFNHDGTHSSELRQCRSIMALVAVALAALTWTYSRRLFGPIGGLLTLTAFVFDPTVLANGALLTSDTIASLFFLFSVANLWVVLHRITLKTVFVSTLAIAGLFVSKFSAVLFVPMACVILFIRQFSSAPLEVAFGLSVTITSRLQRLLWFIFLGVIHLIVAYCAIWALYGFKFAGASTNSPNAHFPYTWEYVLDVLPPRILSARLNLTASQRVQIERLGGGKFLLEDLWTNQSVDFLSVLRSSVLDVQQAIELDRVRSISQNGSSFRFVNVLINNHILPEAFLYGAAFTRLFSESRPVFLNGEVRLKGWWYFFLYSFAVKTPIAVSLILLFTLAIFLRAPFDSARRYLYDATPYLVLIIIYLAFALSSDLNIGHRHLMPIYPPLFILAGITATPAADWLMKVKWRFVCLAVLTFWFVADVASSFPNYIEYFNGFVRPSKAYQSLVDSSLDWGQELPALNHYLSRNPQERVYLSYFGTDNPAKYGIDAVPLFSLRGLHVDESFLKVVQLPPNLGASALAEAANKFPNYDIFGTRSEVANSYLFLMRKPKAMKLGAGTYVISASLLQPLYYRPWMGPWNDRYEADFQQLKAEFGPFYGSPAQRESNVQRYSLVELQADWARYQEVQFARLTAYLRLRAPDEEIRFSLLVYHLTQLDLARALEGPPPSLFTP
jgi:hypothetical protein